MKKMTDDRFTLKEINSLKTIEQGQHANLKYQSRYVRIWLSRMRIEDGAEFNNMVTVEYLLDGIWIEKERYEAK